MSPAHDQAPSRARPTVKKGSPRMARPSNKGSGEGQHSSMHASCVRLGRQWGSRHGAQSACGQLRRKMHLCFLDGLDTVLSGREWCPVRVMVPRVEMLQAIHCRPPRRTPRPGNSPICPNAGCRDTWCAAGTNPQWPLFGALFRSEWLGVRNFDAGAKFRALFLGLGPPFSGSKNIKV